MVSEGYTSSALHGVTHRAGCRQLKRWHLRWALLALHRIRRAAPMQRSRGAAWHVGATIRGDVAHLQLVI
jgi:hypothetical protein